MSSDDPNIHISLSAMAEIIRYDVSQPGKETAGLLIGQELDGVVHIDAIRIGEQTGNAIHVEISEQELTQAAIEISMRDDGKSIVGWWHTHPGLSAFLSPTDVRTQSIYQALMPNAVAIVIDDISYSKSMSLADLDFGVFRVVNGQPQKQSYKITDTVEFGLNAFVFSNEAAVSASRVSTKTIERTKYLAPGFNKESLKMIRLRVESGKLGLNSVDKHAILSWVDLGEAIDENVVKEVSVEVGSLLDNLSESLDNLDESILELSDKMINKQAQRTLSFIILGIALELAVFFFG